MNRPASFLFGLPFLIFNFYESSERGLMYGRGDVTDLADGALN